MLKLLQGVTFKLQFDCVYIIKENKQRYCGLLLRTPLKTNVQVHTHRNAVARWHAGMETYGFVSKFVQVKQRTWSCSSCRILKERSEKGWPKLSFRKEPFGVFGYHHTVGTSGGFHQR
jgi:hypothetical protein